MRILLSIDTWDLIGGSERYAEVIARALAQRGHAVTVLCSRAGERATEDIAVIALPQIGGDDLDRAARAALDRALDGTLPDVIFALSSRSNALFSALLERAPLVRHVQDHTLFCPGLNKLYENGDLCDRPLGLECLKRYWLKGGCSGFKPLDGSFQPYRSMHRLGARLRDIDRHRRAAKLVVASRYMRAELILAGIPDATIALVPYFTRSNTPDIPPAAPPRPTQEFLERDATPIVFTPSRLTLPDKGVDFLLTALGRLQQPFRAVIAGSGPAEDWLKAKARAEHLGERVHFAGWLGPGAIETLYERARVVVCPSVWNEPFGLVGLEAMAHAKPVVAFRVGGIPDWLAHEETGLMVERKDVAALAAAIDRLLADEDLCARFGRAGRVALARDFSAEAHVESIEKILEDAADRG